jgi:membrane-associated phospholipid phosphatase
MEAILQWGLNLIRLVQGAASPPLTFIMIAITSLGTVPVYMLILSFIYWCLDEKKGIRLSLAVLFSAWLNLSMKFFFDQPRPFFADYDPSVGLVGEHFGGFPSGHAQNSLVLFFIIASWLKKKRCYGIAALLCLLIGFSRIYLGVHFPTDVFGGWIAGGLVLCAYFLLEPKLTRFFGRMPARMRSMACAVLAFVMILYKPVHGQSAGGQPAIELLMPAGAFFGMGLGYALYTGGYGTRFFARGEGRPKNADSGNGKGFLCLAGRFVLGLVVMLAFMLLSEKAASVFGGESGGSRSILSANYRLFYFLRFALTGFWVSAGAPLLFRSLGLGGNKTARDDADSGGRLNG